MRGLLAVIATITWTVGVAQAGEVAVMDAKAHASGSGTFSFDVTLRHGDTGWDHYADRWDVLAPDGTVLGSRVLYHPHVDEQPFTRSLSGVSVPEGIKQVIIRAHDKVHGDSAKTLTVTLSGR
jgi:hypothetical protein